MSDVGHVLFNCRQMIVVNQDNLVLELKSTQGPIIKYTTMESVLSAHSIWELKLRKVFSKNETILTNKYQ